MQSSGPENTAPDARFTPQQAEELLLIYMAVCKVLQSGNQVIALQVITKNFEALKNLQRLLPLIVKANPLGVLMERTMSREMSGEFMHIMEKMDSTSVTSQDPAQLADLAQYTLPDIQQEAIQAAIKKLT